MNRRARNVQLLMIRGTTLALAGLMATFLPATVLKSDRMMAGAGMSGTGFKRDCDRVWAFHLFEGDAVTALVDRIQECHTIHDHRADHVSCVGKDSESPCR